MGLCEDLGDRENIGSAVANKKAKQCLDCERAARVAYSDATTPGFFSPYCERHDPKLNAGQASVGLTPEGFRDAIEKTGEI